jgi:hypothetical protein
MRAYLFVAAIAITVLAGPAAAQTAVSSASVAPACLRFGEIYSWNAVGNRTLIVEDNLHQKFKINLMGYCPNLAFKERVGFRSAGAMRLTCMSPGDNVVVNNMGAGFQRCPIQSIQAYTPAMQRADEAAAAAAKPQ